MPAMSADFVRVRALNRLHCLSRLDQLRAKLEEPAWDMSVEEELRSLSMLQLGLTLLLEDLGIKRLVNDDWEITERFDREEKECPQL